jgi:hypothetical protein
MIRGDRLPTAKALKWYSCRARRSWCDYEANARCAADIRQEAIRLPKSSLNQLKEHFDEIKSSAYTVYRLYEMAYID